MTDPLSVTELEDESLRNQFNHLIEAMNDIVRFDPNREEGAYEALNQRIHQTVTDKPILARIFNESNQSLLSSACANLNLESSHHVIKCLIQACPSALLFELPYDYISDGYTHIQILMIANHTEHCVLMPWIATNYTWVLDDKRCSQVVFKLLRMYLQRHYRTRCTSTTIQQFLEAYPRAFIQQHPDDGNILLNILVISRRRSRRFITPEVDADLFKWIADQSSSSTMLGTYSNGRTLLHFACMLLSRNKSCNSSAICKYLIQKCPESVRESGRVIHYLPIHLLQDGCGYRAIREVVVCLLREYPESYDIPPNNGSLPPSSVPFIQSIKPYLDKEKELQETAASLEESTSSLTEAVACNNDQLIRSASTIFDSWATSFINTTEDKLQLIPTQLQDMCNEGRESDE